MHNSAIAEAIFLTATNAAWHWIVMGNSKRKILVIEDESSIVDALRYAFETDGFEVVCAATGAEGLRLVAEARPDALILDVGLPDMSGFDVCRATRKQSAVPILFLTARAEEVDRIVGLEIGADDYVAKPFSPREVVARIRAILRRGAASSPPPSGPSALFEVRPERLEISYRGQTLSLSRYEFRLLAILVRRPGRVFSREELMNLAWECPEMSLERTVDTHIKTIRSKLREIDPGDESIVTHRGTGYSLRSYG